MAEIDVGTLAAYLKLRDELTPAIETLSKTISQFSATVESQMKNVKDSGEKHLGDFSKAANEATASMQGMIVQTLAITAVFVAFKDSLAALGEKQDAINGLNLALAAQGNYSEKTSDDLRKYAESISNVTTFSQNAIIGAEKYFTVLGMNRDQVEAATKATADLAAMTGMDLASAQMQVGKAVETGSSRALKQYGIEVDKSADATTRLKEVVDGIESKMGGAAAAAATTYTGQMKQLGNAIDEAKASFGFFLTQLATPPSRQAIGLIRSLSDFFGKDLVMGIAHVREGISLIPASILDMVAATEKAFASHPTWMKILGFTVGDVNAFSGLGGQSQQATDLANSLRAGADDIEAKARAAIATGIQGTVIPTNNLNPSGFHAADEGKRAEEATKAVEAELLKMNAEGDRAYGTLAKNASFFAAMQEGLGKTGAEFAAKQEEVDIKTDASLTVLVDGYQKAMEAAQKGGISTDELTAKYLEEQQAIIDAGNSTKEYNIAMRDADLGDITKKESTDELTKSHDALWASMKKMRDEQAFIMAQSVEMRKQFIDIAGAASGLASELGIGGLATAFSAVQKGMSDFSKMADAQNPLQLAVATIGFATDIVHGLKSLFGGKTEAEKIGDDLGKGVTDALIKTITDTETKDHVGRGLAEMLNAGAIFTETGSTSRIFDLLNAVALGAVNAKEGITALGTAFTDLQTAAAGGDVASEAAMIQMIERARELKESIPALDAAVKALVTDAVSQLQAFYSGQMPGSGGSAQAAANNTLFDAVAQADIATMGLIEATKAMTPSLDAMMKASGGAGLTGSAADMLVMKQLLLDPAFSGAATGAQAGGKITKDLLDSGLMSQKSLDALSTSTKTFYDQALTSSSKTLDNAAAQKAAEEAALPMLIGMKNAQDLGLKLSPDMQAMLSKAQADGLLPATSIAVQSRDIQAQIRDGIYKLAGMTVPSPSSPGGPGNPPPMPPTGPPGNPYYTPPPGGYGPPGGGQYGGGGGNAPVIMQLDGIQFGKVIGNLTASGRIS